MGRRRILVVSILLLLLVGALLVALPLVAAPMASARLTAALGVPVRIGRIVVSAFGPRISAHGITLRAAEDRAPLATLDALHVDLALRRLLKGEIVLDSVTLDQPHLTMRRTPTGDLDLAALLLPPTPEGPTDAEPETRDMTPIEIGALRIHDGTVEFHDETVTPPIRSTARIDSAAADDLRLTLGGDAHIALRIASNIDDNALDLDLTYESVGADSSLTAKLRTTSASLASVLVHARLDWEHVAGTLDAEVAYNRTVADGALTVHRLTIDATATDLALADSAAETATFRAASAKLTDMTVDLAAQRLDLGTVTADDFWALAYQDDAGLHVPFATPAPEEDISESAWETQLRTVTLGTGTLLLRNLPPGSEDLPIAVRSGRIATEDDAVRFQFDTEVGGGTIGIDGRARDDATTVKLVIDALDVPGVASHLSMPIAFASGKVAGTLDGVFADGPPHFKGKVVATDVKSAPSEAHPEEVFAWATLEIDLAESTLVPPRIHATRAAMTWPYLMLHRRTDGVYPFSGVTTPTDPAETPQQSASTPSDEPLFVLDRGTIAHGRIEFYDTVLDEAYGASMLDLTGTLEALQVAPLTVGRFDLAGSIDELSPVSARGNISAQGIDSELGVDRLRLVPLSRYLEPAINYSVKAGSVSVTTRLQRRNDSVTADNELEISRLKLRSSGRDPFKGELGVALPVALSLMKDSRGDIALDLPVTFDLATQEYELGPNIAAAVRRALLGTLQSPVRILSSVLLGDDGEAFDLKPVPFAAGSAALSSEGAERVAELARLMGRHGGLNLVLLPQTTTADANALAQASAASDPRTLATTRAEVIEGTLLDSYGIDPKRVRARAPEADRRKESAPGVEIQLRSR